MTLPAFAVPPEDTAERLYPPATRDRLRRVKDRYDPDGVIPLSFPLHQPPPYGIFRCRDDLVTPLTGHSLRRLDAMHGIPWTPATTAQRQSRTPTRAHPVTVRADGRRYPY